MIKRGMREKELREVIAKRIENLFEAEFKGIEQSRELTPVRLMGEDYHKEHFDNMHNIAVRDKEWVLVALKTCEGLEEVNEAFLDKCVEDKVNQAHKHAWGVWHDSKNDSCREAAEFLFYMHHNTAYNHYCDMCNRYPTAALLLKFAWYDEVYYYRDIIDRAVQHSMGYMTWKRRITQRGE